MLGDGELGEGQIWEAAMSASHYQLQGLVAIVDRNQLCIDGKTEAVMGVEPIDERFRAFGWEVQRFDGHDFNAILPALASLAPAGTGKPPALIADTLKARGVQRMELSTQWHGAHLAGRDYDDAHAETPARLQPHVPGASS